MATYSLHHMILFTNVSQSHSAALFMTEYFIDQEKYSYVTMLHMSAAFWIGICAMLATETMLIIYCSINGKGPLVTTCVWDVFWHMSAVCVVSSTFRIYG